MRFFDIATESAPALMTEEQFFQRLALEGSVTENVVDFFRTGLPSLTEKLKGYVSALTFSDEKSDLLPSTWFDSRKEKELEARYLHYRDTLVQIPEGFVGEFLPYVLELTEIGTKLFEQTHKLLTDYRFTVASLVSNKNQRTSITDLTASYTKAASAREDLAKKLARYFENDTRSRARIVQVLPTFKEHRDLLTAIRTLEKLSKQKPLESVQRSVREVAETLGIFDSQLKSEDVTDISPKAVKNVATGAYELARYIDQVVAYHYAAISITTCVRLLMEKMKTFE